KPAHRAAEQRVRSAASARNDRASDRGWPLMSRSTRGFLAVALIATALATGSEWQQLSSSTASAAERQPLYYQDPTGKADYSPTPKKDAEGRDYVPVYEEAGEPSGKPAAQPAAPDKERKVLYYRNPMGLPDTSPVPKKDSMNMDYIPVYADEAGAPGTVKIAPERIQTLGVRTEAASRRSLARAVRAIGTVAADERRIGVVNPKFEGWIEQVLVSTTGQPVRHGQALAEIYSPDLVLAQQEYLVARNAAAAMVHADPMARDNARAIAAA